MYIFLAVSLGPAIFLLWVLQRWDAKRPEPPGSVRNVVLLGVASCIPAIIIEVIEGKVLGEAVKAQGGFLNAFFVAAGTEETLKLACVLIYLWNKPHFDEVMDGILYTAAASLGFAMGENVLYVAGNGLAVGILRAFTSIPLHAIASGLMGYLIGRAKMTHGGKAGWIAGGLAVGIGIHGFYDWALMSGGSFGFGEQNGGLALLEVIGIIIVCGVILWRLHKHALALDDIIHGPNARPLSPFPPGWVTPQAPPAPPPPPYPGMPVTVVFPDGSRQNATIVSGQGGHFLCALPDQRQVWVPFQAVYPMVAA